MFEWIIEVNTHFTSKVFEVIFMTITAVELATIITLIVAFLTLISAFIAAKYFFDTHKRIEKMSQEIYDIKRKQKYASFLVLDKIIQNQTKLLHKARLLSILPVLDNSISSEISSIITNPKDTYEKTDLEFNETIKTIEKSRRELLLFAGGKKFEETSRTFLFELENNYGDFETIEFFDILLEELYQSKVKDKNIKKQIKEIKNARKNLIKRLKNENKK